MQVLKNLFNFYISSSIHVAISVVSLTFITFFTTGVSSNNDVLCFVFFSAISGYNFVKYFGVSKLYYKRLSNWLRWIQMLSFISFLLTCFYAIKLEVRTFGFLFCLAVLTVFYAIPVFSSQKSNLRSVRGIKVYLIAFVWAGVTVLVPLINVGYLIGRDIIFLTIQRFLYVLVLMIPFELRDLKYDAPSLSTIPQKLGVNKTKCLGVLLLVVFLVLDFFKNSIDSRIIITRAIVAVITGVLVLLSKTNQKKYYSSFCVEGLPILWVVLILILTRNFF
ncbi:hypothetical protein [Algibacter pectinivorans]|uniref:UbiA prenyltransferase family protein n=1 Tax=Algibacter pectinivorans TaxID=870482 RepID=A0A1I1MCH5_9FLAO|nr:hypothetical protein [Algibacter pectinivorans]SFC83074.1 hypothetical protein SAMN04487987_101170 [Algibacter pectinivorans]